MIFTSYVFVMAFLPITVITYHLINKTGKYKLGNLFLLFMSVLFYCLNDSRAFFVLVLSLLFNYLLANKIFPKFPNSVAVKTFLIIGIIANLASLIYFKYLGFFEELLNGAFKSNLNYTSLLLPLGISYYTFSQISYIVDNYKAPKETFGFEDFIDYALFITYFPKITVGPIANASDLIPQFKDISKKKINPDNLSKGFIVFTIGLSKKVLLADNLAKFSEFGYTNIDKLGTTNALLVMLAYTLQIYFDFSGYCDMAKGVSKMLNIELMDNFLSPYRALSVNDFWKRWHISLTSFFRKYVYIPLGGNKKGKIRTYVNMFIVFFLSGLWHGAALNFIIWGVIHGIFAIISKIISPLTAKIPKFIRFLFTFIFINITWIFFRAMDLKTAGLFLAQLFSFDFIPINMELIATATPDEMQFLQWMILETTGKAPYISGCIIIIALLIIALLISIFSKNTAERIEKIKYSTKAVATIVILFVLSLMSLSEVTEFIYTNF